MLCFQQAFNDSQIREDGWREITVSNISIALRSGGVADAIIDNAFNSQTSLVLPRMVTFQQFLVLVWSKVDSARAMVQLTQDRGGSLSARADLSSTLVTSAGVQSTKESQYRTELDNVRRELEPARAEMEAVPASIKAKLYNALRVCVEEMRYSIRPRWRKESCSRLI